MRVLYHFLMSPYSRRTRLALAHKKIEVELRDGRAIPDHMTEARKLFPLSTVPILVDGARVIGDSTAIARYLDALYTDSAAIFPSGAGIADALRVTTLVDGVTNILIDLGFDAPLLSEQPTWIEKKKDHMARVERAFAELARVVEERKEKPLAGDAWSAADMWLYALVAWLEGLPERSKTAPHFKAFIGLGWSVPESIARWRKAQETRDDVRTIYGG